mgnify:CR=1 FL=1
MKNKVALLVLIGTVLFIVFMLSGCGKAASSQDRFPFTIENGNKRTAKLIFNQDVELNVLDLTEAIALLEVGQNNQDTFYEDSFNLISQCVSVHGDISANFLDFASGLSSSYVPTFSEGISKSVGYIGYSLAGLEIISAIMGDEMDKAVWKSVETALSYVMDQTSSLFGTTSMAAGMFSVGVINYALNEFITTALEGRADMYAKAYDLYYEEKGRKTADWVNLIRDMVDKGTDAEETGKAISAEIKRYVYEFWENDTIVGEYTQAANPGAWSAGSLGGLNDKIKREISEYNRSVIERIVSNILNRIQVERKDQLKADIRSEFLNFQTKMNEVITISITDSKAQKVPSYFAGATLRFVDLPARIEDPDKWETVISDDGTGTIKFRVLAHLLADSPKRMELVKKDGDTETVLKRFNVRFRVPNNKLDLAALYPTTDFPKNIEGIYTVSMYNTTTEKTIDDLVLKVKVTKEMSDGCYADFYLENNGSVYLNGNYFYRYSSGKVNYALGDMSFSYAGNNIIVFRFDAYDNQKKVWGSFIGQK